MRSHSLVEILLPQKTEATLTMIAVAVDLVKSLAGDVAKDLLDAQLALGNRRRQQHDKILAEAITQAESLAYVGRWLATCVQCPVQRANAFRVQATGVSVRVLVESE